MTSISEINYLLGGIVFSRHARNRMFEEREIRPGEVIEAIRGGEVIEEYLDDEPYASYLVFGTTTRQRPLHVVCAPVPDEGRLIIITVYDPDAERWVDFRRRR
jgi:hypothetical protein